VAVTLVSSTAIVASSAGNADLNHPGYGCHRFSRIKISKKSRIVSYITEETVVDYQRAAQKVCCIKMRFYDDVIRTGRPNAGMIKNIRPDNKIIRCFATNSRVSKHEPTPDILHYERKSR
jgi:hypothetical protein